MTAFLKYLLKQLAAVCLSFLGITFVVFASLMLYTPEERADLYLSPNTKNPEAVQRAIAQVIADHHFDEPFLRQYGRWLAGLFKGEWGYSPVYDTDVFQTILRYAPASLELLTCSLLFFIPFGILAGVLAGRKKDTFIDHVVRVTASITGSIPLFILAFIFLAVFYVSLNWFAPGRLGTLNAIYVKSDAFQLITGFYTIDGFLNDRADISLDAARHLAMPAFSLGLLQWATLTRITRSSVIDEEKKDYVTAAVARGVRPERVTWQHVFLNSLSPVMTASGLTAATLTTELFVVELIFNYEGMSQLISSLTSMPDGFAVLGFIAFNLLLTLGLILFFDLIKASVDPRIREEVM